MKDQTMRITMPGSPLGVAWGFLYGCYGTKAEVFMPQVRDMGAGFTKLYLLWSQIEPERGRLQWDAVDAFLSQLESPDEGLIALFSSSPWATRRRVQMLPPSPANDPQDYYRFVHALVSHCQGRVRYWQNDCEPNNPVYWSGKAEEFVAQLKVFCRVVKDADPQAQVVVGGYDGLFNLPGSPWAFPGQERGLAFFEYVLKEGADYFDIFDLRLYADPYTIPGRVAYMRKKMADLGYNKPIICTEYNGPGFFEFPENLQHVGLIRPWEESITNPDAQVGAARQASGEKAIAAMYEAVDSLAPQTQMFMEGCPPELDAKLRRIQCRDLVMRNVLALSAGVQKTLFWDLWHDTTRRDDLMHLMYSKLKLMDYEDGALKKRYPAADAFQRMAEALRGVRSVTKVDLPTQPSVYLFEVQRAEHLPVYVLWERRDAFSGEDQPPMRFELDWPWPRATATDALGQAQAVSGGPSRLVLDLSVTPIFVEPSE